MPLAIYSLLSLFQISKSLFSKCFTSSTNNNVCLVEKVMSICYAKWSLSAHARFKIQNSINRDEKTLISCFVWRDVLCSHMFFACSKNLLVITHAWLIISFTFFDKFFCMCIYVLITLNSRPVMLACDVGEVGRMTWNLNRYRNAGRYEASRGRRPCIIELSVKLLNGVWWWLMWWWTRGSWVVAQRQGIVRVTGGARWQHARVRTSLLLEARVWCHITRHWIGRHWRYWTVRFDWESEWYKSNKKERALAKWWELTNSKRIIACKREHNASYSWAQHVCVWSTWKCAKLLRLLSYVLFTIPVGISYWAHWVRNRWIKSIRKACIHWYPWRGGRCHSSCRHRRRSTGHKRITAAMTAVMIGYFSLIAQFFFTTPFGSSIWEPNLHEIVVCLCNH